MLDDPANAELGRCQLVTTGQAIVVGNPPPTETSEGTPTSLGQDGLTEATCSLTRGGSTTQFQLDTEIETTDVTMTVLGQVIQGASAAGATVTVVAPAHQRNLMATNCTVSAAPPPFAVDVHSFFGRVQCETSQDQGFTDLGCAIDAILSLTYCSG